MGSEFAVRIWNAGSDDEFSKCGEEEEEKLEVKKSGGKNAGSAVECQCVRSIRPFFPAGKQKARLKVR